MDILGEIWNNGIVGSLITALQWLNGVVLGAGLSGQLVSSWALTIILFTVIIKLITLPLTLQQLRSSKAMQQLQPQLQALQKQYGKDREKLVQAQMALYKENKVNPAAGCLPMLIQMPVWIGLYQALFHLAGGLQGASFFWISNLAAPEVPSIEAILSIPPAIPVLAILTGATQWVVQKMMAPPSTDPQQQMMQSMMQFMPLMFVFFSLSVPAGLVLYWVTSNVFMMVQQYFVTGWGTLRPSPAAVPASSNGASRRVEAKVQSANSGPALSSRPESNGHTKERAAVESAIPQAPPAARKRRRRSK